MKSSTPLVVFVTLVLVALGVLVYVTQDRMTPGTTGPEAGGPPATQVAVDAGEAVPASPPAAEQGEAKPADEAAGDGPATGTAADSDAARGEEPAQDGTADAAAESGQQTAEAVPATADDEEPQVQAEDTAPAATDAPVGDETAQAAAEEAAKAEDAPEPADQAADTEPAASSEAADTETAATAEESGADRAAAEEQSGTEPATEQADAASEPDGDSGTQETDVALADPTQQVEETEEPSEAAPLTEPAPRQPRLVTPTFDIVRVEPDGTAVVAGRATVGATVSVLLDGQPIGTAETNERGEWVVVIDEPIAAGSHELSISSDLDGEIMRSEQSVAVVVPETGEERPLIVLSEPGQPSTVLQAPAKTEAPSGPVEVTLDTVDYDDSGEIVFAGRAAPGATLRIYVDNQPLADVRADASGHWQHVASGAVSPGNHSLRIDRIDGTGAVVARVELPFMRAEPRDVAALNAERAAQQAGSQPEAEAGSEPQPDGDTAGTAGAQPSQEELARRYAAAEPAGDDAATATEPAGAEPDGETAAAPAEPAREPGDSAPQPSQEELARKYAATPPAEEPSADASQPEERETDVAVATPPVEDETAGE